MQYLRERKGQLMLEAMIAITVAVMGILGFLALLSNSAGMNRQIADQYIANYLAAEGVEVVKNIVDNNVKQSVAWNSGFAGGGCYELDYLTTAAGASVGCNAATPLKLDAATGAYSYAGGAATPFSRVVTVTPNGPDELLVSSKVSWSVRGGSFTAVAEDHFFNWR